LGAGGGSQGKKNCEKEENQVLHGYSHEY
jgi:hypothetical protein